MRQCNLYEAKIHLSQLVQAALDCEEVLNEIATLFQQPLA